MIVFSILSVCVMVKGQQPLVPSNPVAVASPAAPTSAPSPVQGICFAFTLNLGFLLNLKSYYFFLAAIPNPQNPIPQSGGAGSTSVSAPVSQPPPNVVPNQPSPVQAPASPSSPQQLPVTELPQVTSPTQAAQQNFSQATPVKETPVANIKYDPTHR